MDRVKNPFTPGAGTQPPALEGRSEILDEASIQIKRASMGNDARPQMLLGLRGVGKTVLLNHIAEIAEKHHHIITMIEADENIDLIKVLHFNIQQLLRKISVIERLKDKTKHALAVTKSFFGTFNISIADILSIEIKPEIGTADSGMLEADLAELFVTLGELSKEAGRPWCILIDEVQYLKSTDLAALIVALHKCVQKRLPVLFFGAGLPQVAAMSGDAKSYAERLFNYPYIGALPDKEAKNAIKNPITSLHEAINVDALERIVQYTKGYPYFLQEWGSEVWNVATDGQPISLFDVEIASGKVFDKLDKGFFNVRLDRLTSKEKEYMIAMAALGEAPYKTGEVAQKLHKNSSAFGVIRAKLIDKGMIYSPTHGEISFTVPLFDDFLRRQFKDHPLFSHQ